MNLLLDTHVVIWVLNESRKMPKHVRDIIETEAELAFVSHVSLWEIAMKYPLRRKGSPPQSAADTARDLLASDFRLLQLDLRHILAFEQLPRLHGDPYDRMLVAQAVADDLHLVTADRRLATYSDTIITW